MHTYMLKVYTSIRLDLKSVFLINSEIRSLGFVIAKRKTF